METTSSGTSSIRMETHTRRGPKPGPITVDGYAHEVHDPKVQQVLEALRRNPYCPRSDLATMAGVTRQSIHNWLNCIAQNKPILPRGRRLKYGEPSNSISIRLPRRVMNRFLHVDEKGHTSVEFSALRQAIEKAVMKSFETGELTSAAEDPAN